MKIAEFFQRIYDNRSRLSCEEFAEILEALDFSRSGSWSKCFPKIFQKLTTDFWLSCEL